MKNYPHRKNITQVFSLLSDCPDSQVCILSFHIIEFIRACLLIFVVCSYPHKTLFSDHNDGSDTF